MVDINVWNRLGRASTCCAVGETTRLGAGLDSELVPWRDLACDGGSGLIKHGGLGNFQTKWSFIYCIWENHRTIAGSFSKPCGWWHRRCKSGEVASTCVFCLYSADVCSCMLQYLYNMWPYVYPPLIKRGLRENAKASVAPAESRSRPSSRSEIRGGGKWGVSPPGAPAHFICFHGENDEPWNFGAPYLQNPYRCEILRRNHREGHVYHQELWRVCWRNLPQTAGLWWNTGILSKLMGISE